MPVDGAEFHAQTHLRHLSATPHLGSRSAQGHQTTHQMQPVHRSDQVEERIGWIRRQKYPATLSCCHATSCPTRNVTADAPPAQRPTITPSMSFRRAAMCAHCSAILLVTRTPVLNHSSFGTGNARQSTMFMRME